MSIKIIPLSIEYGVELFAIGDIDLTRSTVKLRQRTQSFFLRLLSRLKEKPQRRLDQLRHGAFLLCGLPAKARHHRVIYLECCLQMANHIDNMAVCQSPTRLAL